MSDRTENRFNVGDLTQQWHPDGRREGNISRYPSRRPLVEETLSVAFKDLRQAHGKNRLLRAADEGKALPIQLGGHSYEIYIQWEPHRLPGRVEKWSDVGQGNCRLYFICPCCRRRIRILYENPRPLVSDLLYIGCKRCLRLVYASENSCKTKWWKNIVRPLRNLYRRREKLLARKHTRRVIEELQRVEELIYVYTQRAKPKRRSRPLSGARRPYKNIGMIHYRSKVLNPAAL